MALILGLIGLYARLWTISYPERVVFDEVHFGNFTKFYILHQFHFDIHPPLGKMLMAWIAHLGQYKGDIDRFGGFKDYLTNDTHYITLRMIPAIFSAFTGPLLFTACRCLDIGTFASFLPGLMIATDTSMIVESKFILSDGMLHFACALHVAIFCLFLKYDNNYLAILAGLTLGAAGSCKLTALGLIAVDGISQIVWIFTKFPSIFNIALRGVSILVPAFFAMYLAWIWHFASCPYIGRNGSYIDSIDKPSLVDPAKINTTYWGDRVSKTSYLMRILRWNRVMNRLNMRSKIPHPWESNPRYWPTLQDKCVAFYSNSDRRIFCCGSPAAYWSSTASIPLALVLLVVKRADWRNLLVIWAWAVSYFPFLYVPRTMFHYHYLIPLMFASMNLGILIDNLFRNKYLNKIVLIVFSCLVYACYLYFSPWIYGTKCRNCTNTLKWVDAWFNGPPKPLDYFAEKMFNTTKRVIAFPK